MRRERRSAKSVIDDYCNELLSRTSDKDATVKLLTIETIALRMGWNDIYNRLRFRNRHQQPLQQQDSFDSETEKPQPWWQR